MADALLAKKLGIKAGHRVAVLNGPEGFVERLGPPAKVELATATEGQFDVVHLFAHDRAELDRLVATAAAAVKPGGVFWISYPKTSSKMPSDLSRDVFWEAVRHLGLRPVSQVSVDEVWSALRFRPTADVHPSRPR